MNRFDIEKIAFYLAQHKDKVKGYKWKSAFDYNSTGRYIGKHIKFTSDSHFDKEILFRTEVSEVVSALYTSKSLTEFETLVSWIVKEWGGIRGIKDIKETINTVDRFLIGDYKNTFDSIAGVSKIAAFVSPQTHIIYDARIAYSMNWILLSQNAGNKFFPANKGRNSRLNAFDMDVLVRLKYAEKYQSNDKISTVDKALFINKDEAYPLMNELIKELHRSLYPEYTEMPFITEMLLFCLADTQVYEEITQKIKLDIII